MADSLLSEAIKIARTRWLETLPTPLYRLYDQVDRPIRCRICRMTDQWRPLGGTPRAGIVAFTCTHGLPVNEDEPATTMVLPGVVHRCEAIAP